jgi:hypothetical protein
MAAGGTRLPPMATSAAHRRATAQAGHVRSEEAQHLRGRAGRALSPDMAKLTHGNADALLKLKPKKK